MQGKEAHARNMRSQLRVAMFHVYGGSDWMNFLLALGGGGINVDLVACYNDEIDRRTPGGAHGREKHVGSRLSGRSLAVAPGTWPLPPVRGVQHKHSEAKLAFIAARDLDKKLEGAQTATEKNRLQSEAHDAWVKAKELSEAAGRAYCDREGHRVNAAGDNDNMVRLVLKAYAVKRGLEYEFDDPFQ